MILWRLAFRNLLRHPWRSLATTLGVALGIAAVLATLSVGDNVRVNVNSSLEAAAGKADLLVIPSAQGRAVFNIDDISETVANTQGVKAVHPVLNFRAEPIQDIQGRTASVIPGIGSGFQLSGRETQFPDDLPTQTRQGELPLESSKGIAIAEGFALERNLAIGNEIKFATRFGDIPFTIKGLLDDSLGLASTNGGRVGVLHLADLQEAIRLAGRASFFEVIVNDNASVNDVRETLETNLGEAYLATLPAGSGAVATGIVDTLQAGLKVLAATLMALGGFLAYNTFAASVVERVREYALLRTICLTKRQVQNLALLEAIFISLAGVLLGIVLGIVLSYGITRVNAISLGFEFRQLVLPVSSIFIASIIGIFVALFAGFLPARAASQTEPIAAGRTPMDEQISFVGLGWLALVLGIISALSPWQGVWALVGSGLSMALLFLGIALVSPALLKPVVKLMQPLLTRLFGVAGKMGSSFTLRNARRNGVAIGTVVVGMGITIGVGAMVAGINNEIAQWVDTTIVGDMFVSSSVGFPEGFEAEVKEKVANVDIVSGVGVRVVRFEPEDGTRGRSVALVLVDPERFNPDQGFGKFQYIKNQGNQREGYEALAEGGKLLAANTLLERFGVKQGDAVSIRTGEGFKDFEVSGVIVDFTGGGEAFVGSLNDVERFGGGTPDLFVMTVKQGEDSEAVKQEILNAFPQLYLDITLNKNYRERILTLTQQTFVTTNSLLVLAVFISALGVANTLGMNLSQRQHEIAVFRTLGVTRRGVRQLMSSEGIIVIVLGTLLGVGVGLLLSKVITAGASAITGFRINPTFPWRLILIAILASPVVGFIASLLPARRAAQLSPVTAMGKAD